MTETAVAGAEIKTSAAQERQRGFFCFYIFLKERVEGAVEHAPLDDVAGTFISRAANRKADNSDPADRLTRSCFAAEQRQCGFCVL
jgi:hypothetical protein